MTDPLSRRRALLALLSAPAVAALVGCGGSGPEVSTLPDQGKIAAPVRKSGDRKPQKGMDRDGS